MATFNKKTFLKKTKGDTLITVAEDLNKVLELDPPIDGTAKKADLFEAILQDAEVVEVSDELADATWEFLEAVGCSAAKQRKEEPKEAEAAKVAKKNTAANTKKKPAGKRVTRPAAIGTILAKRSVKRVETLVKHSDDEFVKTGGKSNPKETMFYTKAILSVLVKMEVITVEEDVITYL